MGKPLKMRLYGIIISFLAIGVFFQNCGQPGEIQLESQKVTQDNPNPGSNDPLGNSDPGARDPVTLITNPSLTINKGALYTNSKNVILSSATIGAEEMIISNSADCTSADGWESFSQERAWVLSGVNSSVSVYAKFRKKGVPETACVKASIVHDNVAPVVQIVKPAPAYTQASMMDIEFQAVDGSGSGVAKNYCKVLGVERECADDFVFNSLPVEGNYSVIIRSIDKAGNESLPVTESFVVDRTAPIVSINGPTGLSGDKNPKYKISVVETGGLKSVACRLSPVESAYKDCSSLDVGYVNLASGNYTLEVAAVDMAGNMGSASKSMEVDLSVPTVTITKGPAIIGNVKDVSFEFIGFSGSRPISKFMCALDGKNAVACNSPKAHAALPDASYTFSVIGTNDVGVSSVAQSYKFIVDTVPPLIMVTGAPTGVTKSTSATLVINATDLNGIALIQCSLNGVVGDCTSKTAIYNNLPDGKYVFYAKAIDTAGNSAMTAAIEWTVDTTPDSKIIAAMEKNPVKEGDKGVMNIALTQVREPAYKCIALSDKSTVAAGNIVNDVSAVSFVVKEDISCVVSGKDKQDKAIQVTVSADVNCGNKIKENGQCVDFKCLSVKQIAPDANTGVLNIPKRGQNDGVCYAMKLFDAIANSSSKLTKSVDTTVLSRDHTDYSKNRNPFNMGSTLLNFVLEGPRVVKLSGGLDATTPIRVDNFALIGFYPKAVTPTIGHYAVYGTSDSEVVGKSVEDSILFNNNPIKITPFASGGTATVKPLQIVNEADTQLNYMLDIRALDCGSVRELSEIYILFQ